MVHIGRPKSDNPKSSSLKVRFDEETNQRLDDYAKRHNITRTEVIRRGLKQILDSSLWKEQPFDFPHLRTVQKR